MMRNSDRTSPYGSLPEDRFWRTGVAEEHPLSIQNLYRAKFEIAKTVKIATAGSCFAQHIGRRLKRHGFNVLNYEPAPRGTNPETALRFGYDIFSARYGNIYLIRQLLQLAREALGLWKPTDVIWKKEGHFYDALRPSVEPEGLNSGAEVTAHRDTHLQAVRRILTDVDVLIFTFGLTEGWMHRKSQTVYPTAPGVIAGNFAPEKHEFKNFGFLEILEDFIAFRELIKSINPSVRFVLTVSPVPLTATASNDHVLTATTYSKSVLRAVAGQLCKTLADVDYFPSYELIASHWSRGFFYESNLRSVTSAGVDAVMRIFFAEHDRENTARLPMQAQPNKEASTGYPFERQGKRQTDVVCEEAMLEAFGR